MATSKRTTAQQAIFETGVLLIVQPDVIIPIKLQVNCFQRRKLLHPTTSANTIECTGITEGNTLKVTQQTQSIIFVMIFILPLKKNE